MTLRLALALQRLNHGVLLLQLRLHFAHVLHSFVVEHLDFGIEIFFENFDVLLERLVFQLDVVKLALFLAELLLSGRQDLLVPVDLHEEMLLLVSSDLALVLVSTCLHLEPLVLRRSRM